MVNDLYKIFDKEGNTLVDATAIGMLFAGVSGCTESKGDPIGRLFFLAAFSLNILCRFASFVNAKFFVPN